MKTTIMRSDLRSCLFILTFILIVFISCTKEAGEGGNASITGKVYVKDYNSSFTLLNGQYYVADEDVYIIYGDELSYGNRIKTNYDGTYVFKFLRKGSYKIYVYSKDSTLQTLSGIVPIIVNTEVTKTKQDIGLPDIVIFK